MPRCDVPLQRQRFSPPLPRLRKIRLSLWFPFFASIILGFERPLGRGIGRRPNPCIIPTWFAVSLSWATSPLLRFLLVYDAHSLAWVGQSKSRPLRNSRWFLDSGRTYPSPPRGLYPCCPGNLMYSLHYHTYHLCQFRMLRHGMLSPLYIVTHKACYFGLSLVLFDVWYDVSYPFFLLFCRCETRDNMAGFYACIQRAGADATVATRRCRSSTRINSGKMDICRDE